jgi:hypothetical protein
MSSQHASASCLALRREVFSVSLDPVTLREMRRGFLPVGALVEAGASVVKQAMSTHLETVAIRVRTPSSSQVSVERVGVESLRNALGL